MANAIKEIGSFLNFWYFRYLLVTELYMVEKWERIVTNVIFACLFLLCFFFYYKTIMPAMLSLIQ